MATDIKIARRTAVALAAGKKPEVGDIATEYIGSDFYARIVVEVTRNGRSVKAVPISRLFDETVRELVFGMNANAIKRVKKLTPRAFENYIESFRASLIEMEYTPEEIERDVQNVGEVFTIRQNGDWIARGWNCGRLVFGYAAEHLDPSF